MIERNSVLNLGDNVNRGYQVCLAAVDPAGLIAEEETISLSVINLKQDTNCDGEVSMNTGFTQLFELTLSEKLQLLEDLWDSIAQIPEQIPVLDWQKEELAKRKASYLQNPGSGSSWEAAKERIRNGHI